MNRCLFPTLLLLMALTPPVCAERPTMEDCAMCHDEVATAFVASSHGRAMASRSDQILATACSMCHEAGVDHMDDPTVDNVSRKPAEAACLSCHKDQGAKTLSGTPGHVRNGLTCLDCHDAGHDNGTVLSASRNRCVACHQDVEVLFTLPFAHRNGLKPFDCLSCHFVHGNNTVARSILGSNGGACVNCHSEKRLPQVFPHPPADRRGCVSCHVAHGTTNPRQLQRPSIMMLCLECHSDVPSFHDVTQPKYRNCQICHTAIHGSNHDPSLLKE